MEYRENSMLRCLLQALTAVLVMGFIAACGGGSSGAAAPTPPATYNYSVPADAGDGWQVANLADEGFDTQKIVSMMTRVVNRTYPGIDSIVIRDSQENVVISVDLPASVVDEA